MYKLMLIMKKEQVMTNRKVDKERDHGGEILTVEDNEWRIMLF